MSAVTLVIGLSFALGGFTVGFWCAGIMCLMQRITEDLDVVRAHEEAEDMALARLRANMGRRRGRRDTITQQS